MLDSTDTLTIDRPAIAVFDRIVCGVDQSPEALEAARQAARLRSPGGILRLASVADADLAVHAGFATSHLLEQLDESARDALHGAIHVVQPDSTHLLVGDPVRTLIDSIGRFHATLVAVGPHGQSRALGIALGGVSTTLLHEAPCSVLLARRPGGGPFPARILVGVDGSPQSLEAARAAESIAARFDAKLKIAAATGGKPVDLEAIQELTPYFVTDRGRPVDVLTELAPMFDLLVIGSRGLHGVAALGSVSERVAHRAPCSVLVVRSPAPDL